METERADKWCTYAWYVVEYDVEVGLDLFLSVF
jgi:hypothetical protein